MLEQLWYTWSAVGLGPLSAGFRIRAASPGLSDVRSPRVQALDRYLRYVLPAGTDPFAITPDMAPVCLSLLQSEQGEWMLVNKTYTGKDDVGRPGAFFVHLLCNFPADFSAAQAISLWRSPFLHSSDVNQNDGKPLSGVRLDPIPFDDLKRWPSSDVDLRYPRGISSSWLYDCFPLVLRAYLMWRRRWEQWMQQQSPGIAPQTEPPRLYVAAPSDMVAAFISCITRCLPPQLTGGLTFSTYEYDVRSKGQVLFVGTSWAPSADGQSANQDLPAACYQEGMAINCYTYDESRTQLANDPLAISFAEYATECLINDNFQELDWLFKERTAHKPNLNVNTFLQTYESYIVKALNPTQQDVELYLADADADMLVKVHVQDLITTLAMSDASWLNNVLRPHLASFLKQTGTRPKLGNALDQLAKTSSQKAAQAIDADDRGAFNAMLGVVQQIAHITSEAWRIQPRIFARPTVQLFLARHPEALFQFIEQWSRLNPLPQLDEVRPFLNVPAHSFEEFYSLNVPQEWKYIATEALITSAIAQNAVPVLGQKFPRAVEEYMRYLVKNAWPKARTLFVQLSERNYPDKLFLLTLLLNSSTVLAEDEIEILLKKTLLTSEEYESFLIQYGPSYLLSPVREAVVLKPFRTLAKSDSNRKMRVLESWLKSESLARWLEAVPNGPAHLDEILQAAPLAPDDSNAFLETYGKHYLERYVQQSPAYQPSPLLLRYLKHYVESLDQKSVWQPSPATRELLTLLSTSPLWKSLSNREQQTVQQRYLFLDFLQHPSVRIVDIKNLGSTLLQLRFEGDLPMIERLAQAFAFRISSATELASVIYSMSKLITKEAELLQMLYTMAEYLRDLMVDGNPANRQWAEARIEPYVEFALCFDSAYALNVEGTSPPVKEKLFRETFLYLLLQNAPRQIIDSLDMRARESNLTYWKTWVESKPSQNSSADGEYLGTLSVYRQPSRPRRSSGQAYNPHDPLDAFLEKPSTGRKEVEALGTILPVQLKGDRALVEELAKAFAICVESETELTSVMMILRQRIPKPYLLQMLYIMAEVIRDDLSRPQTRQRAEALLEPYVRFVLCFESIFETPDEVERSVFVRTFLNLLLQSADENILQQLNSRNWPDNLTKKWQEYRPRHFAGTRF